jgi:hypothetical protein
LPPSCSTVSSSPASGGRRPRLQFARGFEWRLR